VLAGRCDAKWTPECLPLHHGRDNARAILGRRHGRSGATLRSTMKLLCSRAMSDELQGVVIAPGHEGGTAVRITLAEAGLHAVGRDGTEHQIPYRECQLERGGANGKMWFCRSADRSVTILCQAPGFAAALRARAGRELGATLDAIEQRASTQRRRSRLGWVAAVAAALGLLTLGVIGVKEAGQAAAAVVPPSVDRQLGDAAFASMRQEGPELNDPVVLAGVRTIVDRLTAHVDRGFSFRVHVIDADVTNAYALPGGIMVVYTGLLAAAETPEQLAGVLAHEIAHVTERHGVRRIAHSIGVVGAIQLLLGDASGLAGVAVEVLSVSTVNSYSREQEHEADLEAVRTLAAAQIDPRALADFFGLLKQKEGAGPSALQWLSTHPDLDRRISEIERASQASPVATPKPLALDWPELRRLARAGALDKPQPPDAPQW
jgi:Zn-dependent protease with chaperone function